MKEEAAPDEKIFSDENMSVSGIKSKDLLKLKGKENKPFMVSSMYYNGTNIDMKPIYKKHIEEKNLLTMICVNKTVEIPYEVLELGNTGDIVFMQPHPRFTFTISAGAYIVDPKFLDFCVEDQNIQIEDTIKFCLRKGQKIGVYIIPSASFKDERNIPLFKD